jgi:hypothetical protein
LFRRDTAQTLRPTERTCLHVILQVDCVERRLERASEWQEREESDVQMLL